MERHVGTCVGFAIVLCGRVCFDHQMINRVAMFKAAEVFFTTTVDGQFQPIGKGVHDRYADPVQTA